MKYSEEVKRVKEAAKSGGKEFGTGMALGQFSELLCKISEDADVQAELAAKTARINLLVAILACIASFIALGISVYQTSKPRTETSFRVITENHVHQEDPHADAIERSEGVNDEIVKLNAPTGTTITISRDE